MNATVMAIILVLIVVATVVTKKVPFNFVLFIVPIIFLIKWYQDRECDQVRRCKVSCQNCKCCNYGCQDHNYDDIHLIAKLVRHC